MKSVTSLLYVSNSLLRMPDEEHELRHIVAVARERNGRLGVTGALVFTGHHFAQVLEGSAAAVDELMTSICRDRRHSGIDIVEVIELPARRFAAWSLAYSGPSTYVDRHITPLFKKLSDRQSGIAGAEQLLALMQALVSEGGVS
jgi:hypothetical protein